MTEIITLILVGLSVGLGNFAAAVAIGLGGVTKSLRLRIAIVFGLFESGMPIIGLFLGRQLVHYLGDHASLIGGLLLGLTGIYLIYTGRSNTGDKKVVQAKYGWFKLITTGLFLSLDNLIIGFGLGTRHEPLILSVVVIGIASVTLSLVGLELGNSLSSRIEEYSEIVSGSILILVGILLALNIL
jgi:putative Mn2+ efflux pump MntP